MYIYLESFLDGSILEYVLAFWLFVAVCMQAYSSWMSYLYILKDLIASQIITKYLAKSSGMQNLKTHSLVWDTL